MMMKHFQWAYTLVRPILENLYFHSHFHLTAFTFCLFNGIETHATKILLEGFFVWEKNLHDFFMFEIFRYPVWLHKNSNVKVNFLLSKIVKCFNMSRYSYFKGAFGNKDGFHRKIYLYDIFKKIPSPIEFTKLCKLQIWRRLNTKDKIIFMKFTALSNIKIHALRKFEMRDPRSA